MRDQPMANKQIIPGKQNFRHDIAFIAVIFDVILNAQIIETVITVLCGIQLSSAVSMDDFIAFLDKLEGDIPSAFNDITICWLSQVTHELHQRGFPATDRTREHGAFLE